MDRKQSYMIIGKINYIIIFKRKNHTKNNIVAQCIEYPYAYKLETNAKQNKFLDPAVFRVQ